jgi:RNA polymerase sigma-70 factor (ECF subfamily)
VLDEDEYVALEEQIDAASVSPDVRAAIAALPAGERIMAELVILEGLTPGKAAAALGVTSTAARMRLARARMKLRRSLQTFAVPMTVTAPVRTEEGAP